jgi:shikimate kinase
MEQFKMKIILVGFMASGKTTLGELLAEKFNLSFIDTDKIIEKNEGKTVNQIFELYGEKRFRKLEVECIDAIKNKENYVLAVGGGLPCYNRMMDELNNMGTTIFLDVDTDQIFQRIKSDLLNRPLIKELDTNELYLYIKELYSNRLKVYAEAKYSVNFRIETEKESLEKLIHLINFHQKDL